MSASVDGRPSVAKNLDHLHLSINNAHNIFEKLRQQAHDLISWTPLRRSHVLSTSGSPVYVKFESEQVTNSFKARGALYCLHELAKEGTHTVVSASTGNHALGIANALRVVPSTGVLFLPHHVQPAKVAALEAICQHTGMQLRREGHDCVETEAAAAMFAQQRRPTAVFISPYNDLRIMAGQGTIACEILEDLKRPLATAAVSDGPKCCYVTVGGGGLFAGVATKLKSAQPGVWRVIACQPAASAVMFESVKAGRVVMMPSDETLSDGSAGGLEPGTLTLDLCAALVDDWVLVSETEIATMIARFFREERKVVEGAAAVALAAAAMHEEWRRANGCVMSVVIACGGNIDGDTLSRLLMSS